MNICGEYVAVQFSATKLNLVVLYNSFVLQFTKYLCSPTALQVAKGRLEQKLAQAQ